MLAEVRVTVTELVEAEPSKPLSIKKLDKLRSVVSGLKASMGLRQKCRPSDQDQDTLWQTACDLWVSSVVGLVRNDFGGRCWIGIATCALQASTAAVGR